MDNPREGGWWQGYVTGDRARGTSIHYSFHLPVLEVSYFRRKEFRMNRREIRMNGDGEREEGVGQGPRWWREEGKLHHPACGTNSGRALLPSETVLILT